MSTTVNEVVVHLNESVDEATLDAIEHAIRLDKGIVSVGHRPEQQHLLLVTYDAAVARAADVLHNFKERGLHAQVIGM